MPLPLPEAIDEAVAELLDELRDARRELTDAERIVHMLQVDPGAQPRGLIELDLAIERTLRWRAVLEQLDERARLLRVDTRSVL